MLRKLFKTILVLSLCIGISLPTNAAVSVSDGSAFVTKAEFAADLNNLSNRMAQLENSLDAKIDSLVSSYLTRNGIWNGAKQILTTNYFVDFAAPVSGTTYSSTQLSKNVDGFRGESGTYDITMKSNVKPPSAVNSDYLNHDIERVNNVFCYDVSKTGLLYMTVSYYPTSVLWDSSTDKRCQLEFKQYSTDHTTINYTTCDWHYAIGIDGADPFYDKIVSVRSSNNTGAYIVTQYGIDKIFTFVSKGDDIYFKDYFRFKRNSQWGQMKLENGTSVAPHVGQLFYIEDCYIY